MPACIFCEIVAERSPCHRVYEDEQFLAFLDIYPIRPGHTLLIPKTHDQFLGTLPEGLAGSLFETGARIAAGIRRSELGGGDINFVLNDGPIANQTVPHVHLHLLPRQSRDLGKLARMLLQRPLQTLLGPAPGHRLEAQARTIRASLAPKPNVR